jgi:hypothetical protein
MQPPREAASQLAIRHIRDFVDGIGRHYFLRLAAVLISVIYLVGCASTGLPTKREKAALDAGDKAIVLLRVECTIEDQQPYEPFRFSVVDDNISFGLGSFETGGEPERSGILRFLTPESRHNGWTYFVLPHGTYYLSVYPPRRTDVFSYQLGLKSAPRWRIELPAKAGLVYVGTLYITGESDRLIYGSRIMRSIKNDEIRVGNEHELAGKVCSEYFSDLGRMHVALMQRHQGGPVILRSPLPGAGR